MPKICILDYGLGNIQSLANAIKNIGFKVEMMSDNSSNNYDIIFIPGVGSYSAASKMLNKEKIKNFLNKKNSKANIFGICLGMQIFSSIGEEFGLSEGLNFIPGKTVKIQDKKSTLILPFVGYESVEFKENKKLDFIKEFNGKKFYFIHSYIFKPDNDSHVLSTTNNQGVRYCSSVIKDRFVGTQFHPEKSGEIGLIFLKKMINSLS